VRINVDCTSAKSRHVTWRRNRRIWEGGAGEEWREIFGFTFTVQWHTYVAQFVFALKVSVHKVLLTFHNWFFANVNHFLLLYLKLGVSYFF